MAATSALKFVQGGNVGAPATSLLGATGSSVVASNGGDDTQNKTWTYTMVDVPLGSSVPTGVVQSGPQPTFTWTPDVTGGYYLQLATVGNDNSQALDARSFGVLRPSGRYIPAFMSPAAGNNFSAQLRGWAKYLEAWLIYLDGLSAVPAFTGANVGQSLFVGAGPALIWDYAGGLRGHINVNHATPGTFDATHQIAYCDTSTGTCSITFPPASAFPGSVIPPDWQLLVVDTGGVASTGAFTVNPNGQSIWNPTTGSFVATSVSFSNNGIALLWQWDANKSHWVLREGAAGSGGSAGGFGVPGISSAGVLALTASQPWGLFTAGDVVTFPATLVAGQEFLCTHDQIRALTPSLSSNPVTFQRGGGATYVIQQPDGHQSAGAIETGASVKGFTDGANYRFAFDGGSPGVLRCISSLSSP